MKGFIDDGSVVGAHHAESAINRIHTLLIVGGIVVGFMVPRCGTDEIVPVRGVASLAQVGVRRCATLWDFVLIKNAWENCGCWSSVRMEGRGSTGRRVQRTLQGQLVRRVSRRRCQNCVTAV